MTGTTGGIYAPGSENANCIIFLHSSPGQHLAESRRIFEPAKVPTGK